MKRNRQPFTKEEQDYIFENYKGVSGERMAEKLKEHFGTQCSREKVKNFYNLNGQRVSAPKNGLYIVNGKKVVIK